MSGALSFLKKIEIAVRRFLLRFLSRFATGREKNLPTGLSFDSCKFLFVRQDRLGDVLVLTPILSLLKHKYPHCTIDVLLSRKNHFALNDNPHVRNKWIYDKRLFSSLQLLRDIRREKYDFVVDPMDNTSTTSTIICMVAGARWKVGLSKENSYAYDIVVPRLRRRDTHIIDRMAELLRVFDIDPSQYELRVEYSISSSSEQFAATMFSTFQLDDKVIVGINISAGHDTRFWGVERFRNLIGLIESRHPDVRCLILFKPTDQDRAENIAFQLPGVVVSHPTATFDEFSALIKRLTFLITPDTSAVHLAAAFGIPSIVLYVQSNKELNIWRPYGTPCEALIADVDDLSIISPDDVVDAFERLLRATPSVNRVGELK